MRLAGFDLAWKSERNTTAVAFGDLDGGCLRLTKIHPALKGFEELRSVIESEYGLSGVAIDAPLIMNNKSKQRQCERELSSDYGARGASCHSANLDLYPSSISVKLSIYLKEHGFKHLQSIEKGKFQIECYPHPAIIEMFGLPYRLAYKKGKVSDKKQGQIQLSKYIKTLEKSKVISLVIGGQYYDYLEETNIRSLVGAKVKVNEDVLDSILCIYIAALFVTTSTHRTYGSIEDGYIYVPNQICI